MTAMGSGVAGTRPHSAGIKVPALKIAPSRMLVITDSSAMPGSAGYPAFFFTACRILSIRRHAKAFLPGLLPHDPAGYERV